MLQDIHRALNPDGRIVLLEYRKEDRDLPIKEDHKMSVSMVKKELEPEGFQFDELISSLPRQHVLSFKKRPQEAAAGFGRRRPPNGGWAVHNVVR